MYIATVDMQSCMQSVIKQRGNQRLSKNILAPKSDQSTAAKASGLEANNCSKHNRISVAYRAE